MSYNTGKWEHIHFNDFQDLKEKAYKLSLVWKGQGYNQVWLEAYIEKFAPSSDVWMYQDIIELYKKYDQGEITKEKAKQEIKEMETNYNETEQILKEAVGFQLAMNEAFKQSELEYGEVSFECPLCKGNAIGVRLSTPNNIAHKVTIRGKCHDCGYSVMN